MADGRRDDYTRAIDFTQPASRAAWAQQLEIQITPWGFLKAAAANNAPVRAQTVGGRHYQAVTFNAPVKSPGGQPYKMIG